jgi:hypothetical protein
MPGYSDIIRNWQVSVLIKDKRRRPGKDNSLTERQPKKFPKELPDPVPRIGSSAGDSHKSYGFALWQESEASRKRLHMEKQKKFFESDP